jgi:hypothetical protein
MKLPILALIIVATLFYLRACWRVITSHRR